MQCNMVKLQELEGQLWTAADGMRTNSEENRAVVQHTFSYLPHDELPESYDDQRQRKKPGTLYEHFCESYEEANVNKYELVS